MPRSLRLARLAVAGMFFVDGAVIASWAARIPAIQEHLGLSKAQLGVALLMSAIGSLVAMNVAGYLAGRLGSRRVTAVSAVCLCATLPLLAHSPSLLALSGSLLLLGAATGSVDVAMNAQGVAVERRYGRPILNSFHAFFSVGGLAGALIGGIVAARGIGPETHFVTASLVLGAIAIGASFLLLPSTADARGAEVAFALPTGPLLALGLIAFCTVVGEGAMADWSAIYLKGTVGTGAGLAAIGYAGFSLLMATGRVFGDRLTMRFGPVRLVRLGCFTAAGGLALALVFPWPPAALLGFGLVGIGLAGIFPITVSAASHITGLSSSTAIAAVATCGYFGFLVGPALIGFAAQLVTLRVALGLVVLLTVGGGLLAGAAQAGEQADQHISLPLLE